MTSSFQSSARPGQVRVDDMHTAGVPAHQLLSRGQEPTVGQPADGPSDAGRSVAYDRAVTGEIDGDDLAGPPMREPQATVVPAGRLDVREALQKGGWLSEPCVPGRHRITAPRRSSLDHPAQRSTRGKTCTPTCSGRPKTKRTGDQGRCVALSHKRPPSHDRLIPLTELTAEHPGQFAGELAEILVLVDAGKFVE
jgi:hypothetical protein